MGRNVITEARYKQNGNLVSYPLGTKAENVTVGNSTLDVELNDIKGKTDTSFTTPTDTNLANLNPSGETVSSAFVKIYKAIKKLISHISNNTNGENHIPKDGESGQILLWASSGKAKWGANPASYSNFKGATSSAAGSTGLVPAPAAGKQTSYLRGDGTWQVPPGSTYAAGNGLLLSGNTFSVNKMPDKTTTGGLGYVSADAGKLIPTNNTLAYWSGCYNAENTKSNLTHCKQGAFGAAATKSVISAYSDITSNASGLVTGGALYDYLTNFVQYVNKNGDTMTGDLSIVKTTSNETKLTIGNGLKSGAFKVDTSGNLGVYDATKGKWLVKSDTSGNVTLNGNASTSTKLGTARTIRTNLGSTNAASFDGSANITPGVTGTLSLSNGGTGATTAANARTNLGLGTAAIKDVATSVSVSSYNLVSSNLLYTTLSSLLNLKIKDSGIVNYQMSSSDINDIIPEFWLSKGTWIIIASGIFSSANQNEKVLISELGIKAGATPGFPVDIPTQYTRLVEKDDTNTGVATLHLTTINTLTEDTRYRLKGKCTLTSSASNVDCVCRIMAIKIPEF